MRGGVALGHMYLHFAWQAWHLWHWAGSGGALGPESPVLAPRLLAWQAWHFEWQAWHLATSIFTLRGRRRTWCPPSLCVAVVALMALGRLWWRAWFFRCDGRRGSFGVAGVALGDVYLHFAWQACYLVTSTFTLRGRRGTYGTGPALVACLVLGVTLGAATLLAWQAWHLATSIFTLRGRRGTYGTGPALVARLVLGVTLGAAALLAWQAWHLATSIFTLRGRRGTW